MDVREAVNFLESAISFSCLGVCGEAWQKIKEELARQSTNTQMVGAEPPQIKPSCIECKSFYACTQKPHKTEGCFSKWA